jgi:hypothetical protein
MKEEYQKALEMNEAVQKNLDNPHALVNAVWFGRGLAIREQRRGISRWRSNSSLVD